MHRTRTRTTKPDGTGSLRRGRAGAAALAAVILAVFVAACAAPTDVALRDHLEHYGFDPGSLEVSGAGQTVDVSVAVLRSRQDDMAATDRVARLVWEDHRGSFAEVRVHAGDRIAIYTTSELERRWGTRGEGLDQAEANGLTPVQRTAAIGSGLAVVAILGVVVVRSLARPKVTTSSSALAGSEREGSDFVLIEDSERLQSARSPKRTGLPAPEAQAGPTPGADDSAGAFDMWSLVDQLAPDATDDAEILANGGAPAPALSPEDVLDVLAVLEEGCGYRPWLIGDWADTAAGHGAPATSTVELVVKHAAFGAAVDALREVGFAVAADGSDNTLADVKGRRVHIYLVKFDNAGFGWLTSSGLFGAARSFPPTSFTVGELAGRPVLCVLPDPHNELSDAVPAGSSVPSPG